MSDEYELETPTVWQRIFLKSKVNGAPYEEPQVDSRWSWPENTYLQRRLEYLRTYRSADGTLISLFRTEPWEPGKASDKDIEDNDVRKRGEGRSNGSEAERLPIMERGPRAALANADVVEPASVSENGSNSRLNRIPADTISIDIPSDDWAWFADPGSISHS
jgi:hypothetical protein